MTITKFTMAKQKTGGFCVFCNKTCQASLERHLLAHIDEKAEICNICGREFRIPHQLRSHMETHLKTKSLACPKCTKTFISKANLATHLNAYHSATIRFFCKVCNQGFKYQSRLTTHMEIHAPVATIPCTLCSKMFRTKHHLYPHLKSHLSSRDLSSHQCIFCNKKLLNSNNLQLHIRSHTKEKPFTCKLCDFNFSAASSVKKHMKTAHGNPDDNVKQTCNICQKQYTTVSGLNFHMKIHTGEKCISCDLCTDSFIYKHQLNSHRKNHFPEVSSETLNCEICNKIYSSRGALRLHHRKKHAPNPLIYQCVFCSTRFLTDHGLKAHIISHINERPVICKLCGKEYSTIYTNSCMKRGFCHDNYLENDLK